jgi:hypothetical protein
MNTILSQQPGVTSRQLQFPGIAELLARGMPFSLNRAVPNMPQIYVMYGIQRRAGRVGSAQGNNQFRRHAGPSGWFERMRNGNDVAMSRIARSNFCADAHRYGADGFVYVILEQGDARMCCWPSSKGSTVAEHSVCSCPRAASAWVHAELTVPRQRGIPWRTFKSGVTRSQRVTGVVAHGRAACFRSARRTRRLPGIR